MGDTIPENTELQEKSSNPSMEKMVEMFQLLQGLDTDDIKNLVTSYKNSKEIAPKEEDNTYKNYLNKTQVYDDVEAFIYQRGDTKSGRWYLRIYDKKTRKPVFKSLKTTDFNIAITTAKQLYRDIQGKIDRGERVKQITTPELVEMWDKWLKTQITEIPHRGIVPGTYKGKRHFLNNWLEYITDVLHIQHLPIDKIRPSTTRGFASWLESKPKQTALQTGSRSREKINNNVNEILRMYHRLAVRDKYMSADNIPQLDRLKYQPDDSVKRHIPTLEQYGRYIMFLKRKYVTKKHNPLIPPKELEKRKIFSEYICILSNAGFRSKELLLMKMKDIRELTKPTTEDIELGNMALEVRAENSKTGKRRVVICPVKKRIERIKESYKKLGITHEPEDYIFINSEWGRRSALGRMIMYQRMKKTLISSGIQEELDKENKRVSPYSFRHFYAYMRLLNGVSIHMLAKNMGTSVQKIESTYGHINTELHTEELTKGQGILRQTETNITVTRVLDDE